MKLNLTGKMRYLWMPLLLSFLSFTIASCATYQSKLSGPRRLLKNGQVSEAIEELKTLAEVVSDDQLVYLLEYGTALQIAGRYKESNAAFLAADKLADINDFHSVTNLTAATLGSETMVQYKGESYEKVLINAMLAINYLMLDQPDEALVEARRLNEKLTKMRLDGRKPYELNPFAKYLAALIWESDRKFDDAYIEFEDSYKLSSYNPYLPEDLIRSSHNARRDESYKKWKSEFTFVNEDKSWYDRNLGEVVVIFQQGWGPEKHMARGQYRFPELQPVFSETQGLRVEITPVEGGLPFSYESRTIYDVSRVAIETFRDDIGSLVGRRLGAYAAKAVVADQISQKNKTLGALTWIAMNLADQADLRQWSTLPATIQMAKIRFKPGTYNLKLIGLDASKNPTADQRTMQIKVQNSRKTFVNFRALR
jgi:hypothetical protein